MINHDDAAREYSYAADNALVVARRRGWPVVSMKNDWTQVFALAS